MAREECEMSPTKDDSEVKRVAYAKWKWPTVLRGVELNDHLTAQQLAALVEYCGVPAAARKYVSERIRGNVRLGGRPAKSSNTLVQEWLHNDELIKRLERRSERYARVRLNKPTHRDFRSRGTGPKCAQHELALMRHCPKCGVIRVLTDERKSPDGWTPTKDGKWKIKHPLQYALRRVALDEGVVPSVLGRRLKEWRNEGFRSLIDLLKQERAALREVDL